MLFKLARVYTADNVRGTQAFFDYNITLSTYNLHLYSAHIPTYKKRKLNISRTKNRVLFLTLNKTTDSCRILAIILVTRLPVG